MTPSTRRTHHTRWLRSTVAVAAVTITLAGIAACGSDDDTTPAPTSATRGSAAASTAPPTPLPTTWEQTHLSEPVLEPDATRIPFTQVPNNPRGELIPANTTLPTDVMWQGVACDFVPFSADAGPTRRSAGGWPTGWARTAKGAALAAWSIEVLEENMPDRGEFIDTYLTGDTTGFANQSAVRDPRAGVRAQNWKDPASCIRARNNRRPDLNTTVTLDGDANRAAVYWWSPKFNVGVNFSLVWDDTANDWRATADAFRAYWRNADRPSTDFRKADFTW